MSTYFSESDRAAVALTLGRLQGTLAGIHEAEETETSARLLALAEQLQKLLFPRADAGGE